MYVGNVRHHGKLGEEYMRTLYYLCLFSINLNLFQNKKVTLEIWLILEVARNVSALCVCVCVASVTKSRLVLCAPMDCSPLGSSVRGLSQARILEWVTISYSRGSLRPRDRTHISRIGRRILYYWMSAAGVPERTEAWTSEESLNSSRTAFVPACW